MKHLKTSKRLILSALTLGLCFLAGQVLAEGWAAPCIPEPYDHQYTDETRCISVKSFKENDIAYFVADIQLKDAKQFKTALSGGKPSGRLETLSSMAQQNDAVLAFNGDDYGVHKYGTIIRNGELIRTHDTTRHMLIVDRDGNMSLRTDRKGESHAALGQELLESGTWQTFEFGPALVQDGQALAFSRDFDLISIRDTRREPRTAIGQIGPLHYVVIVADGRRDGHSIGMTLPELQQLFVSLGAQTALNLDGGGSTELWFQGEILNRPAGGKEREMSDMIFF